MEAEQAQQIPHSPEFTSLDSRILTELIVLLQIFDEFLPSLATVRFRKKKAF